MSPVLSTLGGASQFGFGRSAKITIQRPIITLDTAYSGSESSTITRPRFTSSAFVFSNGVPSTAHASSDWQFSTSSDFSSTLSPQTLTASTTNKTSYTISTKFAYTTLIYARVRYRDNASPANVSDWSIPISFTTQPQPAINTPSILSPTESEFLLTRTIFISTSNFGVSNNEDNETHASTTYQVSDVADFSSTVYNVTSTTNLTSITTPDVGGGIKYIRVKHNGSGGIAISNWSPTRTITIAWADTGAGVGTFYPDSNTFVVTTSKTVTLSPGNYRVNLYGGGGGAAAGGSNGSRRGGYAGCVQKDVYFSTSSNISFGIAGGGGGASSNNVAGSGGSNGGGAGGSAHWAGGGGGGYSSATFPGSIVMYAAGGGGAAGDGISEGRSARRGTGTEWYGDSENKLVRKGTGAGGISVRSNSGTAGVSEIAGGGGAGAPSGQYETERLTWGGDPYSQIGAYVNFKGRTFNQGNGTDYQIWNFNGGESTDGITYYLTNYQQAGGGSENIRPNAWVSNNFKTFNMTDFWPNNNDGPYQDLDSSFSITALIGYFYNSKRYDGVGTSNDDLDSDDFRYYHNTSFMAGDGGTNSGSFGRSYAEDWGVANGYYYNAVGYTFGDAGDSNNGWNGRPGGATIQRISSQVAPNCSIISHPPSGVTYNAGDGFDISVSATDTNNAAGVSAFRYQWQLSTNGGSTWANITGATDSTLRRYSRCYYSDNTHRVRCVVTATNGYGSSTVTSNQCIITINRSNYQTIEPTLPFATYYNYPGSATLSGFTQDGVYADTTNWSTNPSHYRTIRDIPSGYGKIRVRWNTVIAGEKDFGPTGGTGCSNGFGTRYTYELRLAVLRTSDNSIIWSNHDRWFDLRTTLRDDPSSDSGRVLTNWDFNDGIDLDPSSSHKLIIQYKSSTYERCRCTGCTNFDCDCFNTGEFARFRVQFRTPGYFSQTKALYAYDTRPSVGAFDRG